MVNILLADYSCQLYTKFPRELPMNWISKVMVDFLLKFFTHHANDVYGSHVSSKNSQIFCETWELWVLKVLYLMQVWRDGTEMDALKVGCVQKQPSTTRRPKRVKGKELERSGDQLTGCRVWFNVTNILSKEWKTENNKLTYMVSGFD